MLELLLTYAIPFKDTKPIAKDLLEKFGGLRAVLDAEIQKLTNVSGIGESGAVLIKLVKELKIEYQSHLLKEKETLSSSIEVFKFVEAKLSGLKNEVFMVIYLNTKNRIINFEVISEGTIDQAVIYPRKVLEKALKNNATSIILSHNHPSGEIDPSSDDIHLKKCLKSACSLLDISVLDHIIVGKGSYFNFNEKNML